MLRELSIRNFAIIDDLHVRFPGGLVIFSGETGAGKSIIINAVNLLLGGRASAGLIRSGADTAELEALFEVDAESRTARQMARHAFDVDEGLIVRRIISRTDRHRITINGRLSTVQTLMEITENLASISGQHAHQGLLKEENHLLLLDQFGGLMPLRAEVGRGYHELMPLIDRLHALRAEKAHQDERRELMEFQMQEIRAAAVLPDEDDALAAEAGRLKNVQLINHTLLNTLDTLYDGRGAVVERLKAVQKDLFSLSAKDPELAPTADRISGSIAEIEDTVESLRVYAEGLSDDPNRLEAVEERLYLLNRLKRKYGNSLESVAERLTTLERGITGMEGVDREIAKTQARIETNTRVLLETVRRLSRKRAEAAGLLSREVARELASLKMASGHFDVQLRFDSADERSGTLLSADGMAVTDTGMDRACFLISPNVGEALKPLAAIASGGELSRVVLALKAILAATDAVETVVFDEVDAGIGGEVAAVVGRKLAALAASHQVICITHLPQIARFGDHHFRISKQVSGGRTRTVIQSVTDTERVAEIARMLGGETVTPTTVEHAKELLSQR